MSLRQYSVGWLVWILKTRSSYKFNMPEFEFNSTHSEQEWTIVWGNCIISSTRKIFHFIMFCCGCQEKNSQISTYLCHHWQADKETDYTHYTSKYDSPMTFPQKHRKHVHYCSYQSFLCNKLKDNIKLGLNDIMIKWDHYLIAIVIVWLFISFAWDPTRFLW